MSSQLARYFAIAAFSGLPSTALMPAAAAADEASRISRLESELQLLRSQLDEQNRRIQRLEAELNRRAGPAATEPLPRRRIDELRTDQPATGERMPWHSPEAWEGVVKGMTAEEVTQVLGEPTAVESVDAFKTLFYRGASPRGASLSGHVNLRDERVVAVSKPAF